MGEEFENEIVLSEEFYSEINAHRIPTDLDAVKLLISSPAVLDLFMWLSYRSFTAKGEERIPLFGPGGLTAQLGSIEYARPRKFRERLEQWLASMRQIWPECRAHIAPDGSALIIRNGTPILPGETIGPLSSASALLRWEAGRCRTLYSGNHFEGIRRRLTVRGERKVPSPAARLGTLVMSIGGGSSPPPDPGDPSLLHRIEAHIRESGDLEVQQLVKEYLAEV